MTLTERFFSKVQKLAGSCWIWTGSLQTNGYPRFSVNSVYTPSHRWIYVQVKGKIPKGYDIHHRCQNPLCVNPSHLEAVTRRVNLLSSDTIASRNAHKTQCPRGHRYSAENTYIYHGLRYCRKCRDIHRAANRIRNLRKHEC